MEDGKVHRGPGSGSIRVFKNGNCSICDKKNLEIVLFDEDWNDGNGECIDVCKDCLKKALEMLE